MLWKRLALTAVFLLCVVACSSSTGTAPFQATEVQITGALVDTLSGLGGAELLDVTPDGRTALVVGAESITAVNITGTSLTVGGTFTIPPANLPVGATAADLTGVAISPDGTFALVGVKDNTPANLAAFDEVPGKVIAISIPGLTVLGEVTVGRGPDSVAIAPNGQFAAVANEDEEDEETVPGARPGSISIIDLRNGPANMTEIEQVAFPPAGIPFFPADPQPETVTISPDSSTIFVTLQENNAISRIRVNQLAPGGFTVTNFDAGQRTGRGRLVGSVGNPPCTASNGYADAVVEPFTSSREPDGIAFTPDGRWVVTGDEDNVAAANGSGVGGIFGARSISVFSVATGALLGDSGNTIEEAVVAARLPMRCNSKGPEPEVVDVGVIGGRLLAFTGLERSDALTIHDITDPSNIKLVDLVVLDPTSVGADRRANLEPEGVVFIPVTNQVLISNTRSRSVSLVQISTQ
jgi:DNA-binding beta-propeller fold protein YncE